MINPNAFINNQNKDSNKIILNQSCINRGNSLSNNQTRGGRCVIFILSL